MARRPQWGEKGNRRQRLLTTKPARTRRRRDRRIGGVWDPINLTPEQIALACMQGPPKKEWDFLNRKPLPPGSETSA